MPDSECILEFEAVDLVDPLYPAESLRAMSFSLRAGESLLIRPRLAIHEEKGGLESFPLADCVEGLWPCSRGMVRFQGRAWSDYSTREQWKARAQIGRVFAFHAWVNNLTVLENLTLAGCFHQLATASELERRAVEWARRFGLDGVPGVRPGFVGKTELRRLEWVRAFLLVPRLLLLEFPEMDAPWGVLPLLVQAVVEAMSRGAAVLWITDDPALMAEARAHGAVVMEAVGGQLKRVEENGK